MGVIATLVGLAFRPVFAPEPVVALAVGGAVGAVAVSTLATRVARWPASAAALVSLAIAPAVLGALAWRSAADPVGLGGRGPGGDRGAEPHPVRPAPGARPARTARARGGVGLGHGARRRRAGGPHPCPAGAAGPGRPGPGRPAAARRRRAPAGRGRRGRAGGGGRGARPGPGVGPPADACAERGGAPTAPFWRRSLSRRQPTPPEAEAARARRASSPGPAPGRPAGDGWGRRCGHGGRRRAGACAGRRRPAVRRRASPGSTCEARSPTPRPSSAARSWR